MTISIIRPQKQAAESRLKSMIYIIDLTIVFSPDKRTLSLQNDEEQQILLSNQGCRLLKEMVTNSHKTLNRDELLKRVWGDYGFTQSNNSLNVAISEIRKAFEVLDRDPQLIATIPKLGFCFRGIVQSVVLDSPDQHAVKMESNASIPSQQQKIKNVNQPLAIFAIFAIFIFLFMMVFFTAAVRKFYPIPISQKKEDYTFLYDINHCSVYVLGTSLTYNQQPFVDQSKKDIAKENIDCNLGKKDVFYAKIRENNTLTQITLIGICSLNKNGDYSNCLTIKNFFGAAQ